jgi:hypothetical protein
MSRIIALSFVPLIVCILLALGVHAQAGPADTASDAAPAAVQSDTAATPATTTGGAATTRAPGGLAGTVGTGGLAPAGTNEAQPQSMGAPMSTTGGPSTFAPTVPAGAASALSPGPLSPGTWVPGLGMMPGTVVGPNLGGAAQTPVAIPSGVAVGNDGRPARARNVGEGEGESPASANAANTANTANGANGANGANALNGANAANAGASTGTNAAGAPANMALPAQVFIVAPGFVPANAATGTNAGATTAGARSIDNDDDVRDPTPIEVTSMDLASAPESYGDRKLTLRGRVTSVNGNTITVTSRKTDAATTVIAPALSDSPLREDVIVTGTLENRDGQRVLVAESVIQIER